VKRTDALPKNIIFQKTQRPAESLEKQAFRPVKKFFENFKKTLAFAAGMMYLIRACLRRENYVMK